MRPIRALALAACVAATLVSLAPVQAGVFDKSPEKSAAQAAQQGMPAVTVWIDASWGLRNQGAANDLSRAHKAFAAQGYRVVDVAPYIENGDLQGFFVTYEKIR